ncbi:hypothetical protein CE195_12590 [Sodalis-like symbiont of Philaenus spumarius]|nr:hypothetical protein CE195_12590 [Sodalis-like symbiont of Philaenus spumarius]
MAEYHKSQLFKGMTTFGPRTDETCRELLALLTPFNIGILIVLHTT